MLSIRTVVGATLCVGVLAVSLAASGAARGADQPKRLTIGATNPQISHYAYFAAVSKLINQKIDGYTSNVIETGATIDNLNRMQRGQIDLGLITSNSLHEAYYGKGKFSDKPVKSGLLWLYSEAPQLIVVTRESGIDSIEGLNGKPMGPGPRGSSTEQTSVAAMKLLSIEPKWVRGSMPELTNAIKDARSLGVIHTAVKASYQPVVMEVHATRPLRVLGLTDAQVEKIAKGLPEISILEVPANKTDLGTAAPVKTWAFLVGVSAAPNLAEDDAYRIVKAVMEDKVEQKAAFAGLVAEGLIEATLKNARSPLHPGAIRYYEERGYTIPARLRP